MRHCDNHPDRLAFHDMGGEALCLDCLKATLPPAPREMLLVELVASEVPFLTPDDGEVADAQA